MSESPDYLAANRALWDEWSQIHATGDWYDLGSVQRGADRLRPYEVDEVGDVTDKSLLHLMCQLGTDTVGWARRGARVTGVDFSPRAIELATRLAAEAGVSAEFICSDVLSLPDVLAGSWDVVYTSRGVLGWISDLGRWAEVAAHYLSPGGVLYLTDIHPIAKTLDDGETQIRVTRPYFPRADPIAYPVVGSYTDPSAIVQSDVKYLWTHSVAELVTSVARAGLVIDFLHEFEWLDRPWPFLEQIDRRKWVLPAGSVAELPFFLSLRAHKPS